jgi:hypothetical protein
MIAATATTEADKCPQAGGSVLTPLVAPRSFIFRTELR